MVEALMTVVAEPYRPLYTEALMAESATYLSSPQSVKSPGLGNSFLGMLPGRGLYKLAVGMDAVWFVDKI